MHLWQALAELFSDVGPVKRAFIIRDKDGQSKGFGFVQLYVGPCAGGRWRQGLGDVHVLAKGTAGTSGSWSGDGQLWWEVGVKRGGGYLRNSSAVC